MRRSLVARLALLLLAAAGSAVAGTVYVPVPDPAGAGGSSHVVQIWITNAGTVQRPYAATFLAAESDGTQRPGKATDTPVAAGRTALLGGVGTRGKVGMLEIAASSQMAVDARLVSTSPSGQVSFSPLPVISSANAFAAGATMILQGLGRDGTRGDISNLALVNLAQQGSQCQVKILRADGSQIGATAALSLKALSMRHFPDAFGLIGEQKIADARIQVTCSQAFYAFANLFQQSSSQLVFVMPSASGDSTLGGPGGGTDQPPPTAGSVVFSIPGLFHTASVAKPKEKREIVLQKDLSLRRLVIDMDFVPGPWNREKVPGNHGLIWLYLEKFRGSTIANVNAFSPPKLTLKAAQNVNLPAGSLTQEEVAVPWEQGRRYHVKYTYDAEHGLVSVVLSAGGSTVKSFSFPATAPSRILSVPARGLMVDFGHNAGQEGPEVPDYGWSYYDFRVEMVPQ